MSLLFLLTAWAGPRIEIPLQGVGDLDVVPAPRGLVLFQQMRGDRRTYDITGYDLALAERWRTTWQTDRAHEERSRNADDHFAWVLATRKTDAQVLRVGIADGSLQATPVLPLFPSFAQSVVSDGLGGAWVSGVRRKRGTLSYITPTGTSFGVDTGHRGRVVGLTHTPSQPGRVQAVVHERAPRLGSPLTVLDLQNGEITGSTVVQPYDRHLLLTGRTVDVGTRTFAAGTWSSSGVGSATGFYVARLENGAQVSYAATAFADLDNPLAHLSDRREERATTRIRRKRAAGGDPKLRWDLLLQDPIPTEDGFLLVAEAFNAEYTTRTVTESVPDGRGGYRVQQRTIREFAGYSFSHVLVVGFDADGNRRFDHSVRMRVGTSPSLRTHVRATSTERGITLVYPHGRDLRRVLLVGDQLIDDDRHALTEDAASRTVQAGAMWWHDDRFLVYGIDRRLDRERGEPRRVYFLSEMEADR